MSKRGGYLCLTFRLLLFTSTFVLSVPFLHIRVRVDNGADIVNEFRSLVVQGNSEERDRKKNGCDVDLGSNRDAKHGYSGTVSRRVPPRIPRPFREGKGCHMCFEI